MLKTKYPTNIGEKYGAWTVQPKSTNRRGDAYVDVRCDCGVARIVAACDLVKGRTMGCLDCMHKKRIGESGKNLQHGHSTPGQQTSEYRAWGAIAQRCNNPKCDAYKNYGARGIKLCPEWTGPGGFKKFIEYLGDRPSPNHSIDRIDNDKDYEPGNVRWTDRTTQSRNRRTSINITIDGETKSLSEWASLHNRDYHTVWGRIQRGMTPKDALTKPFRT